MRWAERDEGTQRAGGKWILVSFKGEVNFGWEALKEDLDELDYKIILTWRTSNHFIICLPFVLGFSLGGVCFFRIAFFLHFCSHGWEWRDSCWRDRERGYNIYRIPDWKLNGDHSAITHYFLVYYHLSLRAWCLPSDSGHFLHFTKRNPNSKDLRTGAFNHMTQSPTLTWRCICWHASSVAVMISSSAG